MESLIATRLNRQWREIVDDPCPWQLSVPCPTLGDVRAAASCDAVAAELLQIAQSGDELAGRVLVQAMLPKLICIAAKDRRRSLDEYISTAWLRISSFPFASRRRAVLTNLALDTLKWVSRADQPRELPTDRLPERWQAAVDELDARELIEQSRELRLVSEQTAEVLLSVYSDGLSGRETAELHGLSETAVRYRCSAATRRIRENVGLLTAA